MAAVALLALAGSLLAQTPVCERVYTLNADFDKGTLLNVNYDLVPDQLQLNQVTRPFPFVNIACSGRGTIVRIDVDTGQILGEFLTAPNGMGRNPSRTTVDKLGNVWVANRDESGGGMGSVTRVALVIGGIRCDADGTPNPGGQYLKPPFQYSTAVDRDGDGLIKTSYGLGNILPWSNAGSADSNGGVSTAEDECIINYTRTVGSGTRTVAVDANNDVWVGGLNDTDHEKLSGVTGQPVPGTQFNFNAGGYGGLIDGNGVLWSARGGTGLLRFVPNATPPPAGTATMLGNSWGDYGLGIDPATGNIWHSSYGSGFVSVYLPDGTRLAQYPQGNSYAQGVCVDAAGNVWVAHSLSGSTTVGHLRTDGTYVGTVAVGNGPTGVAVDANGKIWVACYNSSTAHRIDPAAGPIGGGGFPVGAVDLTVNLGSGAWPYNYSDMTGFIAVGATMPSGSWTVVHDCGVPGTRWGTVEWTGSTPAGTSLRVAMRAADSQAALPSLEFVEVEHGVSACDLGMAGQFVEVQVSFAMGAEAAASPVLYDLTVRCCNRAPIIECQPLIVCADPGACGVASVDPLAVAQASDPDGDPVEVSISPAGPYPVGDTAVTLTATDPQGASASCEVVLTVVDCEPPAAACQPTTNPGGENVPAAGTNPRSGQNPDGFYQLLATDNCGVIAVFVLDSGSSFVAGPFQPGDKVKVTQTPGGRPRQQPMSGVIVAHIFLKGDAIVIAADAAGNVSAPSSCLVPPPPR